MPEPCGILHSVQRYRQGDIICDANGNQYKLNKDGYIDATGLYACDVHLIQVNDASFGDLPAPLRNHIRSNYFEFMYDIWGESCSAYL